MTIPPSLRNNVINFIAVVIITEAVFLAMFAFVVGRADATVKTAVVLCITNLVSTLVGIGGGLLGGYQMGKGAAPASVLEGLPGGSKVNTASEIQTPPITLSE